MQFRALLLSLLVLVAGWSHGQEEAAPPAPAELDASPAPALPSPPVLPKDDGSRVSILGYHEFSPTLAPSQMRIRTATFRKHMEALKNLGLPVISLADFMAWKRGDKSVPARSIMITIDDGWKSAYTEAYAILKEYNYPFTIYLYKNYVDGGGRALTTPMIKEMQQNGCTIGSHSVSHPFPVTVKRYARMGPQAYDNFLRKEFGDSKSFLEAKFKQSINTYAYPGGYHTEDMYQIADEFGYDYLFTVLPGKIRRDLDNRKLPRYIIHGNSELHFEQATTFQARGGAAAVAGAVVQTTPHPVQPEPGSRIETRLPTITVDLAKVEGLDPASLVMRVSGFGKVVHQFNSHTSQLAWTVNRPLRHRMCEVNVQWRLKDKAKYESPMRWSFLIEREAAYQIGADE